MYAELHCISNFTFLRGASRPEELVETAAKLGYHAIAITDECSLAGVVKAHVAARDMIEQGFPIKLIIGSEFTLPDQSRLIALAPDKPGYEELSAFISLCRRRSEKGEYQLHSNDLTTHLQRCLLIWIPENKELKKTLQQGTKQETRHKIQQALQSQPNLWVGYQRLLHADDNQRYQHSFRYAVQLDKPMVACGNVHMHCSSRKTLQDTLSAIHLRSTVQELGDQLLSNSENYLRPLRQIRRYYPEALLRETLNIADRCHFSLDELRYQYPQELVPPGSTASNYLAQLVESGARQRWQGDPPQSIREQIGKELTLIKELHYEYYFLTVYDIVRFARDRNILCQGRGSAANSVICYCLFITEVDPSRITLLFERFISKERNEPPDIDVDFEHERREEVIQYIYKKYTRQRAALTATVITYRSRSAIRDVGKALGFDSQLLDRLSKSLGWWHKPAELEAQIRKHLGTQKKRPQASSTTQLAQLFMQLVQQIMGFPRHLSQHVGGFIISDGPVSRLVPVENASMPERTIVQWDKEDIEALGLLKVDVLALGMLSAIRKMLGFVNRYQQTPMALSDIPDNDDKSYKLLCRADSVGIFQVESRAQMSMLPRLKPRCFYDLVIQVAIVRPGPIQGNMVHPFLRRRQGIERITYDNDEVKAVLQRTLGVPIFQEQVIKLAMVAAGFSGGEADQLRRAMASWGKNGNLLQFRDKLINGMQDRGHGKAFAERLFEQMKGFGSYGFPESHAASFALLVYISAWFKAHHPAAFYAGLINSQPMGFYSPSQLLQDAKRHKIKILAIDVQYSGWDCSLDSDKSIRLGLRLVKGLSSEAAERIEQARNRKAFDNLNDLTHRAGLDTHERQALIRANATASFTGHRHQSYWQNLAINQNQNQRGQNPLMQNPLTHCEEHATSKSPAPFDSPINSEDLNDNIILSTPSEVQDIRADYSYTGLTLRRHPMLVLREKSLFKRCKRFADLKKLSHKRFVTVAGIVTGRQRPGTATGVIFLTLEDETGNINVVVWRDRQQQNREVLLKSRLLLVKGVLEREGEVMHVIAGQLVDCSQYLEGFSLPSRDFH